MEIHTWPRKDTAFVVIHGAGAHRPFKRLDDFVRGFWQVLQGPNPNVQWRHKLQRHEGWIESYVSLAVEGKPALDFYEYYWDCYMDHEINLVDVIRWFDLVSSGAKKFYRAKPEDRGPRAGEYLKLLGPVGRLLGGLYRLRITRIPVLGTSLTLFLNRLSRRVVELAGDVVIYVEADVRSQNYAIRQKVLRGAVEELKLLLEAGRYDQVIVAGHSLGSLISYDALNRITLDVNAGGGIPLKEAQKIAGLVTFGSPLDKVAFFFHQHTRDQEYVRRQILAHLHAFKRRLPPGKQNPVSIDNPIQHRMDQIQWLNFYHPRDPVSDSLVAYQVDRNIACDAPVRGTAQAHEAYWTWDGMYEAIGEAFF
ncbi:MAG: hypothetical protein PVF45_07170 [Anaerolineae bacterium]|jgi:hypothetical protein